MENQNEQQYMTDLLNKFKEDPQFELKQEFGKMLMRNINTFSLQELARYNELKTILDK